jgi:hypothetical protein
MRMKAERFDPSIHSPEVDRWWAARGAPQVYQRQRLAGWYPPDGFIVMGVAAIWLYGSDAAVAFVQNFTSNPMADAAQVHNAVGLLLQAAERRAAERGFRYLQSMSGPMLPLEIAMASGWAPSPSPLHSLIKGVVPNEERKVVAASLLN